MSDAQFRLGNLEGPRGPPRLAGEPRGGAAGARARPRHNAFDPNAPGFTPAEAAYLTKLFDLVDMAIVEKMQTFVWFQSEGRKGASFRASRARVDRVIGELGALEAPANLFQVQRLMVEAVREQRAFF